MKRFYIADWHYGHANAVHFDNRPFNDVEEMNEALIDNWNNVVSDNDIVYILGDMFWCNTTTAIEVLKKLNGHKILIKGNHDKCHDATLRSQFDKIVDYLEINDSGKNVILCHYPIPCFKNHFYGWYHLYGHVHASFEYNMMESVKREMRELYDRPCEMYNVGAMMNYMNFTPRTLEEILLSAKHK